MSSSAKTGSIEFVKSNFENEFEFLQVVKDGRRILEIEVEYQTEEWAWTGDLDDAGIFIFSYLLYDYKKKILSLRRLKESVYTLNLLRQKMIPSHEKTGIPLLENLLEEVIKNFLVEIKLRGTLAEPKVEVIPIRILSKPFNWLFG